MTDIRAATVDVYVLRRRADAWDALLLQRAEGTRCTGAWEAVHGHIEEDERPEHAARRELREETGLVAERLYNVIVQPFYLHTLGPGTITLAVAFAAVVAPDAIVALGDEHQKSDWMTLGRARSTIAWPRSRDALAQIEILLATGDAGPLEDVLRVE
ncbi:MAG: NUDIX domain-containing protein [Gemmatimonadota bacterium]|nr:NUDIX domain-containing protein [Gemmatimonadota bacterium]